MTPIFRIDVPQVCLGMLCVSWLSVSFATFGSGPHVQTSLMFVIALGLTLAAVFCQWLSRFARTELFCALATSACGLAVLYLPAIGQWLLQHMIGDQVPSEIMHALSYAIAVSGTLLLPTVCVGLMLLLPTARCSIDAPNACDVPFSRRLVGLSVGALLNAAALSAFVGQSSLAMIAAIGIVVCGVAIHLARRSRFSAAVSSQIHVAHRVAPTVFQRGHWVSAFVTAVICGTALLAMSRFIDQVTPSTLWAAGSKWALFVMGLGIGASSMLASRCGPKLSRMAMPLLSVMLTFSLAAFPNIVELCLDWNSTVDAPALQLALRILLMATLVVPIGICVGTQATKLTTSPVRIGTAIVWGLTVGLIVGQTVGLSIGGVSGLLIVAIIGGVLVTIRDWMQTEAAKTTVRLEPTAIEGFDWRSSMRQSGALIMTTACAVTAVFVAPRYQPALSAKLLFDSRVFVAHRVETRTDILPHLDEARCLSVDETWNGTLTQWRLRGAQTQFRQSGVLTATQSLHTTTCPQPISEALQVVLPLVLHEKPNHVAVLGLRSGLAVETALQFPVQSVLCAEPDSKLTHIVQRDVWSQLYPSPSGDDRLVVSSVEPLTVLLSQPQMFDLIISNTDQAALFREAQAHTAEYLQIASKALAPGGLFCQRFPIADFGQESVAQVLATWQSAFEEVAVVETSPGEWLLIGSNESAARVDELDHQPIVSDQRASLCLRPGLIERLQRPHVRQVLADIGWDWASPLLLSTMLMHRDEAIITNSNKINAASSCRLAGWLPWDLMRWTDKLSEINSVYGSSTATLAARLGVEAEHEEVKRRLTELKLQRDIVRAHPDQFWAYRKVVKQRLIESPHEQIVQVKGQRPTKDIHPTEKRRLQYFETLGMAAKLKAPTPDDLQLVTAFQTPHDPLISPFLHQEVAELASKNREANLAFEWQHRLRAINHSEPGERSVRDVAAAIEMLCRHPELIEAPADRGDQLDALLQMLNARWYARREVNPNSVELMLSDVEHSIAAIDLALPELTELRDARNLTTAQWDARQTAIEKSLVRPLRDYRTLLFKQPKQDSAKK